VATAAVAEEAAAAAILAEFPGPAALLVEVWAEVEEWVPMAATVVEFAEPAGCPAAAVARPVAGFQVAAEVSGCSVEGSAAIVLARRWSRRGCSGAG
jgi:hypothetical protein